MSGAGTRICAHEGCDRPAPYGYGLPGFAADKPLGKRGYLWVCADHHDWAEGRRQAAIRAAKAPPHAPGDPAPEAAKQGSLL